MSQCFYYVDGIPTKGKWIDMDLITDTDEVLEELAEAGYVQRNEGGEPEYGGDLLVADAEGLASVFLGSHGTFDFDDFVDCRDYLDSRQCTAPEEALIVYINYAGSWSKSDFEEVYNGEHDSEKSFAEELVDELGYLSEMPEHLRSYFDYEKFARDIFITDYWFEDGFVFRRN